MDFTSRVMAKLSCRYESAQIREQVTISLDVIVYVYSNIFHIPFTGFLNISRRISWSLSCLSISMKLSETSVVKY